MANYQEVKPKLKRLHHKNGVAFNMAVSYLLDAGFDNVPAFNESVLRDHWKDEENHIRENGGIPVISVDFKIDILRLAKEIAKIATPWDILTFAKDVMDIYTGEMTKERLVELARDILDVAYENKYEDDYCVYDTDFKEKIMRDCYMTEEEWDEICRK